jgi:hypothetical protein
MMTFFPRLRLFFLLIFCSSIIIIAALSVSEPVKANFVQDEEKYWNRGNLVLPSDGDGGIEHCTLESSNLKAPNNVVGFNVYTPPSYSSSSQNYPVIYLLHGLNGHEYNYFSYFSNSTFFDSSGSLPSLIDNGLADEAILVFVNGGAQSFYNDWSDNTSYGPSSDFPIMSESVIMNDVIPFVDANFRTIADRNGRAIEGFSMGGRGAVKLAIQTNSALPLLMPVQPTNQYPARPLATPTLARMNPPTKSPPPPPTTPPIFWPMGCKFVWWMVPATELPVRVAAAMI